MEFIARHKKAFIIAMTCLCLAAAMATAKAKPQALADAAGLVVSPLQGAFSSFGYWIDDRISFLASLEHLHRDNIELKRQNAELLEENQKLEFMKEENKRLTELLEVDQLYADYPKVGARIIGHGSNDWFDMFTINKGADQGIKPGMIAIAPGGAVGVVSSCASGTSSVRTLMDEFLQISAQTTRTKEFGFVKGDSALMRQGLCRMDFLNGNDAELLQNDTIVTSQFSVYYPAGVSIGKIVDIIADASGKHAVIEPAVDLSGLETILIVTQEFKEESEAGAPSSSPAADGRS
jgi:rod shape-determining protein MreC